MTDKRTRSWNPKSWSQELLSPRKQASLLFECLYSSQNKVYNMRIHVWSIYSAYSIHLHNSHWSLIVAATKRYWCLQPHGGMCSFKKLPYLWFSSSVHLRSDVLSYNIAVCNVSASRLAGSDDLHDLTSSEAIVPSNRIRNLYSWKLFDPMHSEKGRVTNFKGC